MYGYPLVGCITKIRKIGYYNFVLKYKESYGDMFIAMFGGVPRLFICDADYF